MNVFLFAVGVGRGREWELEMIRGCFGEANGVISVCF